MFDPAGLVWTSREEVTSALLSALDAPPSLATTAMDLCGDVAPPSAAPALLAVARARDRPYWVRVYALRAHDRTGARLRDEALESFFAECLLSPGPSPHDDAAAGVLALRDVLAVVKTPANERIAMRWLARSSPDVRAEALVAIATSHPPMAPQTHAWLAEEWLAREGRGCSPENHRAVETHVFHSRRAAPRDGTVTARRPHPRERLALGGARSLRKEVRRAVVDRSAQLAREDFTPAAEPIAARYRDVLDALRGSRDGPALVTGLLRGVALDARVRADLVRELLKADPARAIELIAARPDADENRRALRVLLSTLAGSGSLGDSDTSGPRVPDEVAKGAAARALASQALRMTRDEAARYLAVGAIEATGEPPGWSATLRALTGCAAPLVQVRALSSLVRRGIETPRRGSRRRPSMRVAWRCAPRPFARWARCRRPGTTSRSSIVRSRTTTRPLGTTRWIARRWSRPPSRSRARAVATP